jgi:lipooligosaccharide transport system permease protein
MILTSLLDSAVAIAEKRATKPYHDVYSGRSHVLLQRSFFAMRSSSWLIILSGFFEPVFYLLSFGFGVGQLVGDIEFKGESITYIAFIAPALLATSAMNGAIYDSTWNVFFKMRYARTYQGMLSTSLGPIDVAFGEIRWALLHGFAYSLGFMAIVSPLGIVISWWALLAVPTAVLIAFGFASLGMSITSYLTSFQQMNWLNFFLLPMFLFSGTFFPLDIYPEAIQFFVKLLPLWHAVELMRDVMLGALHIGDLIHIAYFLVMIAVGLTFTTKRLTDLFMR